jgi:hypothetical protein
MSSFNRTRAVAQILQNHPGYIVTALIAAVLAIPPAIEWYGQHVSVVCGISLAVFVAVLLALFWLAPFFSRKVPTTAQTAIPPQPLSPPAPSSPPLSIEDSPPLIPPDHHEGQHLYQDAFLAMAAGAFQGIHQPYFIKAGKDVVLWVDRQFFRICQAYPGTQKENLKSRYFELAYQLIRRKQLLDPLTASMVVPAVENFVTRRFSSTY